MEGKNAEEAITFRWERGCLFAVGIAIEQSVNSDLLPEKTQLGANKRHERDGQHHHITVIHRTELDSLLKPAPTNSFSTWLAKQQKSPSISSMDMAEALWQTKKISVKTMTKPSELSTTEWNESHLFADLGLGSNKQVYYKVICWPFGDAIRAALGLSVKQFHITVGFQEADRHDIDKGPNSLRATYIGLNNKKVYLPLARVRLGITMVKRQCELLRDIDAIDATLKALEMHLDYWQTHADTTVDANTKHEVAEVYYSLLAAKAFFMHRIRDVDGLFAVAHEMIACQPLNYQGYVYQGDAYFQQQKRDSAAFVYWIALSCLAASSTSASTVDGLALQSAAARRARDYLWHALERCMKYTDIFIELTTDNTSIHNEQWDRLQHNYYPLIRDAFYSYLCQKNNDNPFVYNEQQKTNLDPVATKRHWLVQPGKEAYRLPRYFSWIVPYFLAGMSTPRCSADVQALRSIGFSLVATATVEEPLPAEWFADANNINNNTAFSLYQHSFGISNLFLPVKNYDPPTTAQVDAFLLAAVKEHVASHRSMKMDNSTADNTLGQWRAVLVHCGGGKGRAGCFIIGYLLRYGLSAPWPMCNTCQDAVMSPSTSPTNENVLWCLDTNCVHNRPPAMSAEDAVAYLRNERPGSIETEQQMSFLRNYASKLWCRFQNCGQVTDADASENDANTSDPLLQNLKVTGNTAANPHLLLLVGLPGSGKSWFSEQMAKRNPNWRVVSQDELGGREAFERVLSSHTRQLGPNHRVILDRCHVDKNSRQTSLKLAFQPSAARVAIVYFNTDVRTCEKRAAHRISHPTLMGERASRVIKQFAARLTVPTLEECNASVIWQVNNQAGAEQLLNQLCKGISIDEVISSKLATKLSINVETSTNKDQYSAMNQPLHPDRPPVLPPSMSKSKMAVTSEVASSSKVVRHLSNFCKYPRTQHLSNLGAATRDDLVLTARDRERFFQWHQKNKRTITVEEKLDGANVGIRLAANIKTRLDADHSAQPFLVQNRSHYVTSKDHVQFESLRSYLFRYREALLDILLLDDNDTTEVETSSSSADLEENELGSLILFGEWLAARHSVEYTSLPDRFVAFDVYDTRTSKFWSRQRFQAVMQNSSVACAPTIIQWPAKEEAAAVPATFDLVLSYLERTSAFGTTKVEGVVVRVDDDQNHWLLDKVKLVRSDFIAGCASGHWTKRQTVWNGLDASAYDVDEE